MKIRVYAPMAATPVSSYRRGATAAGRASSQSLRLLSVVDEVRVEQDLARGRRPEPFEFPGHGVGGGTARGRADEHEGPVADVPQHRLGVGACQCLPVGGHGGTRAEARVREFQYVPFAVEAAVELGELPSRYGEGRMVPGEEDEHGTGGALGPADGWQGVRPALVRAERRQRTGRGEQHVHARGHLTLSAERAVEGGEGLGRAGHGFGSGGRCGGGRCGGGLRLGRFADDQVQQMPGERVRRGVVEHHRGG
jgi:hypothetical protein